MLADQIKSLADEVEELEHGQGRLRRVCQWVINAYENPDEAPQTLEFQINQMKEILRQV